MCWNIITFSVPNLKFTQGFQYTAWFFFIVDKEDFCWLSERVLAPAKFHFKIVCIHLFFHYHPIFLLANLKRQIAGREEKPPADIAHSHTSL